MKLLTILLVFFSSTSFAQQMEYPELNVTPRAKDRIRLEIKDEAGNAWANQLPIQLAALTTLTAATMVSSEVDTTTSPDADLIPAFAMGVGALWIGYSAWAAAAYRPYRSFFVNKIRRMPYRTLREKLTVERLAEEELNSLASSGARIRYFAAATNLATSIFLLDVVKDNTDAKKAAELSILTSLTPLFFPFHWEKVAKEQEKYKKKIFSPVAMTPIMHNPFSKKFEAATGLAMSFRF